MTYVIHDTLVPMCIYRFRPKLRLSDNRHLDTREEADLTDPESRANRPRTSSDELADKISKYR